MRFTLIVVRRIVAIPKTAGAGVILEASFPIFTRPMATSSERMAPSRFVGCLDLSVMVETQDSREVPGSAASRLCGRFRTPSRTGAILAWHALTPLEPFGEMIVTIEFATIAVFENENAPDRFIGSRCGPYRPSQSLRSTTLLALTPNCCHQITTPRGRALYQHRILESSWHRNSRLSLFWSWLVGLMKTVRETSRPPPFVGR